MDQNKTHASESNQKSKTKQSTNILIVQIIIYFILFFIIYNAYQTFKPKITSQVTMNPTPTIYLSPVPTETFDTKIGNNPVASKYAQEYLDLSEKVAPGAVKSVRLELSPEDTSGKTEAEYKKDIRSAFLTVTVTSTMWSSTSEDAKKDFIAAYVNAVKNTFSGFPHVYINNGVRTVGEGEWSVFGGEAKVALK